MSDDIPEVTVTPAEKAVLDELMRDGASAPDIADRLGLGTRAVGQHLWRVMHEAGYTTRTALVVALGRGRIRVRVRSRQRRSAA